MPHLRHPSHGRSCSRRRSEAITTALGTPPTGRGQGRSASLSPIPHQAPAPSPRRAPASARPRWCFGSGRRRQLAQQVVFEALAISNKIEIRRRSVSCSGPRDRCPYARRALQGERIGRFSGRRPSWKKAFVTLKPATTRILRGCLTNGAESYKQRLPAGAACEARTSARSRSRAREEPARSKFATACRKNHGRVTRASRWRSQAAYGSSTQAQQDRIRNRRRDRVRPEPHGGSRSSSTGRREGVHPRAADLGGGDTVVARTRPTSSRHRCAALSPAVPKSPRSSPIRAGAQLGVGRREITLMSKRDWAPFASRR